MSDVKRSYTSPLREDAARQTRRVIVEAGVGLYLSQGYGRTTVDAIAAAAGVSRKTVFTSVGGKAQILKYAVDWAVVGDDEPVPLSQRPEIERLKDERDPEALLRGWVAMGAEISRRVADINAVLTVAAGVDDDARQLLETVHANRLSGARAIVRALEAAGGLQDGLSTSAATDIAWLHGDPHLYRSLVGERGWSHRRFTAWIDQSLARQLLHESTSS